MLKNSFQRLGSIIILIVIVSFGNEKNTYKIFDKNENGTTYNNILEEAHTADIVLFGELHDNPINHWLEIELTKDLYAIKKNDLIQGAEMFESDDQLVVNEYLQSKMSDKTFDIEAKLWPNYKTDYKPLLDFAKTNNLKFIASNIPRRYANLVYNKGLEQLNDLDSEAYKFICPLPMAYDEKLKCYQDIFKSAGGHGGSNLPKSQAIKDATMAHFILKNWKKGKLLIHYNGTYHSNYHQGIEWYLKKENPNLKIVTIAAVNQIDIEKLSIENLNLADFTIVTTEGLTKSQ